MDLAAFRPDAPGDLVPVTGSDARLGAWEHVAFVPHPLPGASPDLSASTYRVVADARAALAALDSTASRLPNPRLMRRPALQAEAQSTSALEGTYAPLLDVLTADEERPPTSTLREVLNYVAMGNHTFDWLEQGRPLTLTLLEDMQRILFQDTPAAPTSGSLRQNQVVIGRRADAAADDLPVRAARFVPSPPGLDLRARVQDLLGWMQESSRLDIDPVVAAGMAHYQFETLHPFSDGNGRIGRLLVVAHLLTQAVLKEPTLTVSPWFEARRLAYYQRLLDVSTHGDWNSFIAFFAEGLEASARSTLERVLALVSVQTDLKERVRRSPLRAERAHMLVDFAVAHPSFSVRQVQSELTLSYGRANALVAQLVELGVLQQLPSVDPYRRRFYAPDVLRVLTTP